jgi:uncharacterized protein (TIGR02996 family)
MSAEVERGLVAAVRTRPDDWRAWLVYADWLLEQGDSRGELVMLEHRIAVEPMSRADQRALQRQAYALTRAQHETCLAALALPEGYELELRHGFVVGVRLPWSNRPLAVPAVLAVLDALVAHPLARLLTQLSLQNHSIGDDGARALAALGTLCHLTDLDLDSSGIGPAGARALAASGALCHLTKLRLRFNHIGPDGARALAASATLCHLTELDLGCNHIGDDGAFALAASGTLCHLTQLHLGGNDIGEEGQAALAASESLRGCHVWW